MDLLTRGIIVPAAVLLAAASGARAQFSPGELSAAHSRLEGMQNCTSCHEVGNAISGTKCLGCHQEIAQQFQTKHGYHFTAGNTTCVSCHKEHLGKNARTYKFDPGSFDHRLTGYSLSGKHSAVACEKCHRHERVVDPLVAGILAKDPHPTYLGLGTGCADCHRDPHAGRFAGKACSSCHSESGWKQLRGFDHGTTDFPLTGKHAAVACAKCHTSYDLNGPGSRAGLIASSFTDCTPCHATPHASSFNNRSCSGCHRPEGWSIVPAQAFDHALTAYPLRGRHAELRCEQCHTRRERGFRAAFRIAFGKCTDCHADRHKGAFTKTYGDDCAACHTERGYVPSTFTLARHQRSSWPLTGAHQAILCADCHRKGREAPEFLFAGSTCAACHDDVHRGQFARQMRGGSCERCHSTAGWKETRFDHASVAGFALEGRHAEASCGACHKEILSGGGRREFRALPRTCESCHRDIHGGQFAAGGATGCDRCHAAGGSWNQPVFDHRATRFPLEGAHAALRCAACHPTETVQGAPLVRYTPLSPRCESCHQAKELR